MNLDDIRIASPCPASWADMEGDERKRLCGLCKLHVYNFAEMTREEVETLVGGAGDRVCVQLYRRKDGTILFKDCPVGVRAVTRRFFATMAASVAVLFGALLWGMNELRDGDRYDWGRLANVQPVKAIIGVIQKLTEPKPDPASFMRGRMVCPGPMPSPGGPGGKR